MTWVIRPLDADADIDTHAFFYRHFGFSPLPGRPDRLLLPATVLRKLVQ